MFALFLTTTITCSQAYNIIRKIETNYNLPESIRVELLKTIRETIPSCPVKVKKDQK